MYTYGCSYKEFQPGEFMNLLTSVFNQPGFWGHYHNCRVIGNKVRFFLIYRDNFNFEECKSFGSWLKTCFSFPLTPAHTWKVHSLPKCLMNLQWLILLIILLQILMTLSDDSISHLEFMHIHISLLLPQSSMSPSLTGMFLVQ